VALGVGAYLCWGFFPLYFPLLEPAGSMEVLAHRVLWSLVVVVLLLTATRRWGDLRAVVSDRRVLLILAAASVFIAVNWGTYIYGVTHDHVIEASLGYYFNPLVTVLLGVVVLGERLRRTQWLAVGLAFVAVVVLTLDLGRLPWISLVLAFSFALYGLMKNRAGVGTVEGLGVETAVLVPVAIAYLVVLAAQGDLTFGHAGAGNTALLITTGIVTAVPLLFFGAAATRLSLTTMGLLQYLTPTIQFFLGVVVLDEQMSSGRWVGFSLVWVALAMFSADAIAHRRRTLRVSAEAIAI